MDEIYTDKISEEDIKAIKDSFENNGGLKSLNRCLIAQLKKVSNVPINIAVVGKSGCGKSTFINAIRGVSADDESGAQAGETESTQKLKSFEYPDHPTVTMWDLPGIGTPSWLSPTYDQKVELNKFDVFIILSSERFTEFDMFLVEKASILGKKCIFARTKITDAIENHKKAHPKDKTTEDDFLEMLRSNIQDEIEKIGASDYEEKSSWIATTWNRCKNYIKSYIYTESSAVQGTHYGLTDVPIFLIDNYATMKYDFGELNAQIVKSLPETKRDLMILASATLTEKIVHEKKASLHKQIWRWAALSFLGGATPIPGMSLAFDAVILNKQVAAYKKAFGLDDRQLRELASLSGMTFEHFKSVVKLEIFDEIMDFAKIASLLSVPKVADKVSVNKGRALSSLTSAVIEKASEVNKFILSSPKAVVEQVSFYKGMQQHLLSEMVEKASVAFIPILGFGIAGGISFGATYSCLSRYLTIMEGDAMKVIEHTRKHVK